MKELNTDKCLVVFSGGMDSTTCLGWSISKWGLENVSTLTIDYGQRHVVEIEAAQEIVTRLQVEDHLLFATDTLKRVGDSALLDIVAEVAEEKDKLPASFVPGRNLFFLIIAAAVAYKKGCANLVLGVSSVDYSGYPDCRRNTITAMELVLSLGMETDFFIHTPLMFMDKAATFEYAVDVGILEHVLTLSRTCYEGSDYKNEWGYGCGECPACVLRKKGWRKFKNKRQAMGCFHPIVSLLGGML